MKQKEKKKEQNYAAKKRGKEMEKKGGEADAEASLLVRLLERIPREDIIHLQAAGRTASKHFRFYEMFDGDAKGRTGAIGFLQKMEEELVSHLSFCRFPSHDGAALRSTRRSGGDV